MQQMFNKYCWLTFQKNSIYFNPRVWNLSEFRSLKHMNNTSAKKRLCRCVHRRLYAGNEGAEDKNCPGALKKRPRYYFCIVLKSICWLLHINYH